MKYFLSLLLLPLLFILPTKVDASGSVVQFGDSLTQGMYTKGGLLDKYSAAGFSATVPGDEGSGGFFGQQISGVMSAVDANADKVKAASAIVVELGTNPGGTGQAQTIKSDMGQMIDKIRGYNSSAKIFWVNLVVTSPAPLNEYSARNQAISDEAAAKSVTIIDWFHKVYPTGDPKNIQSGLVDSNNWITDSVQGIHMEGPGYTAMAQTIVTAVSTGGTTDTTSQGSISLGATNSSECIMTKIGSPLLAPTPPPWCTSVTGSGGGTGVIKAGEDIKASYAGCQHDSTSTVADIGPCLVIELTSKGYSKKATDAFLAQYPNTKNGLPCTECLGYVSLVMSLLEEKQDNIAGDAAATPAIFGSGDFVFKRMSSDTPLQPGDIAVKTDGGQHIAIVNKVDGNLKFIGLEANWKACAVSDDQPHNKTDFQIFYRKQ